MCSTNTYLFIHLIFKVRIQNDQVMHNRTYILPQNLLDKYFYIVCRPDIA